MNLSKLDSIMPKGVVDQIPQVIEKFGIDSPSRLSHFLAQCAHESGNFKFMSENLNYSAKGLMGVFKKYFPTEAIAKQFER